jgi:hypothetical protein
MPPRRYYHVRYQTMFLSEGLKIIRFVLYKKIKKALCEALDSDKTFEGE